MSFQFLLGKSLSSRHIREVLVDLDERSTQTERANRETVSYWSRSGIDTHLHVLAPEVKLGAEDREMLAGRIGDAIHAAGEQGARKVEVYEAAAITTRIADQWLAETSANEKSATPGSAEPQRAGAIVIDNGDGTVGPSGDPHISPAA